MTLRSLLPGVTITAITLIAATLACAPPPEPEPDTSITWYRDALPVVQARCQSCHEAGSVSGLDLTQYETARDAAVLIGSYVQTGLMPPWLADEDACTPMKESRRLTDEEVATLVAWAEGGALEGNPDDAPEARVPQAGLDRYDVEADTGVDYLPDGSKTDDYRCLILQDGQRTGNRQVTAFEVMPDRAELLHHVVLYKASRNEAQALDDAAEGPGWPCFGGPGTDVAIAMGAWAPGMSATEFPPGTGVALYTDEVVIMQLHYNMTTATPVPDRTKLRLQYAEHPVTNALLLPLVNHDFEIPPHSTGYKVEATEDIPLDVKIWGLAPHMHKLGRKLKVTAADTCLVDIPSWDFNWQQFYFFDHKGGIPLQVGDKLKITCEWDNPTDATITWGENTSDEMCLAFVYVTP